MKTQAMMLYIILFLSFVTVQTEGNSMENSAQVQLQIDNLAAKLENYEIGKIEILKIPAEVLTRTRITPEILEKQFDYKFTIRDIRGVACRDGFIDTLKSMSVQPLSEMPDLRFGVIFYTVDGKRLEAIYFDKIGNKGGVGNIPVSFKGNFFKWINGNISKFWQ